MFEYSLRVEDRVAFSQWALDANGKAARLRRRLWCVGLGACLLVFMVPVAAIVGRVVGPMGRPAGLLVTWSLCTLIWLGVNLIWPNLLGAWLTRRITTAVTRSRRNKPDDRVRLWLDEDGVGVWTPPGQTHLAWSAIHVGETPHHVFILFSESAGFILPKRVEPGAVAGFAAQLRANLARSRQPVPEASPTPPDRPGEGVPAGPAGTRRWVPPVGVVPLSAFAAGTTSWPEAPPAAATTSFPTGAPPMLSFTTSIDDLVAAVLDFPPRMQPTVGRILKAGWRRWPLFCLEGFLFGLLGNLLLLHLPAGWAAFLAVVYVALLALLRWSRLDHTIKRKLPIALEVEARNLLAKRSDQRRVWADATGITVADAILTQHIPWHRAQLVETDRHVIVGTELSSVAIPRHVGRPLITFLKFVRSCGVG